MIHIGICEDNPQFQTILATEIRNHLVRLKHSVQISLYSNGKAYLDDVEKGLEFDITFLDIEMPGFDGRQVAQHLRQLKRQTLIIFLTNHSDYAREGYQYSVHRYIIKNEMTEELPEALDSAIQIIQKKPTILSINTRQFGYQQIIADEILYFEHNNRKLLIHTKDRVLELKERVEFHTFATQFNGLNFYPCFRGVMVNIYAVWGIKKDHIVLENEEILPISRGYQSNLVQLLTQARSKNG